MNRRIFPGLILVLGILLLTACGNGNDVVQEEPVTEVNEQSDEEVVEDSSVFGKFLAIDVKGNEVTQEIFAQAELTMVNIWGTFCGPCIYELPGLGEIAREYEGTDFQLVGIISDIYKYGDETVDEIIELTGADYTHILLSIDLYNNYLRGVQSFPTTIFVDREGNQVGIYSGAKGKDDWVAIIEELRAQISE